MLRYFFKMHDGSEYEIDELDYNHLQGRISNGRYKGFYTVRGEINSKMRFNFEYFVSLETKGTKLEDKTIRNIDINKRKPPEVGKVPEKENVSCHDWNVPDTYHYVQKNIGGKMQYRKQCPKCKKISPLVKPKEVEHIMKINGKTLDDVAILK